MFQVVFHTEKQKEISPSSSSSSRAAMRQERKSPGEKGRFHQYWVVITKRNLVPPFHLLGEEATILDKKRGETKALRHQSQGFPSSKGKPMTCVASLQWGIMSAEAKSRAEEAIF